MPQSCRKCNLVFSNKTLFNQHYYHTHAECKRCNLSFDNNHLLRRHQDEIHAYCTQCDITFQSLYYLKKHRWEVHTATYHHTYSNKIVIEFKKNEKKQFTCFCGYKCKSQASLQVHLAKTSCVDDHPTQFTRLLSEDEIVSMKVRNARFQVLQKGLADPVQSSKRSRKPKETHVDICRKNYTQMTEADKWVLNSGRTVEDVLFEYSQTLEDERDVHDFILNTSDARTKELFTPAEWKEILETYGKVEPVIPSDLMSFLNEITECAGTCTMEGLQQVIEKHMNSQDQDVVTLCRSFTKLLDTYYSGSHPGHQQESWYTNTIWIPLVDLLLVDKGPVHCVRRRLYRNKGTNMSFQKKENNSRVLEFALRKTQEKHSGVDIGTYRLIQHLLSSLSGLANYVKYKQPTTSNLEVVGCLHKGCNMEIYTMDSPQGYVFRLSKTQVFTLPSDIKDFPDIVPLIKSVLIAKFRSERCIDLTLSSSRESEPLSDEDTPMEDTAESERSINDTRLSSDTPVLKSSSLSESLEHHSSERRFNAFTIHSADEPACHSPQSATRRSPRLPSISSRSPTCNFKEEPTSRSTEKPTCNPTGRPTRHSPEASAYTSLHTPISNSPQSHTSDSAYNSPGSPISHSPGSLTDSTELPESTSSPIPFKYQPMRHTGLQSLTASSHNFLSLLYSLEQ
ncbi:hypothetical protein BDB01DRAFT_900969 [Pilobolus umbonatus]|nr:hypothetical protein BDB01DRAFT_900969 [Pilobolus umbonatus]